MADKSIVELFRGYLADSLTEGELRQLIRLVRAQKQAPALLEEMDHALRETRYPPADAAARDASFQRVLSIIRETPARKPRVIVFFQRAAAVLLLLVASWLVIHYIHHTAPGITHTTQTAAPDIAPGGNKAILTLGNGQKIILDSAANGLIAQQGSASIQKVGNDQVAYSGRVGGDKKNISYNMLSTPRGGQYQLILPDGTHVWLNAASSITYPTSFKGLTRQVSITGEAYLEVSKNTAQPFIVKTNGLDITVLGTSFDINAYTDEPSIKTTLVTGSVKVSSGGASRILKPGQQARANGATLDLDPDPDIEKTIAWKEGRFLFDRDELPAIMRQLARWYDVQVEYRGTLLAYHFTGIISRSKNLSQVLNMLKATGNIRFSIEDKKIVIVP